MKTDRQKCAAIPLAYFLTLPQVNRCLFQSALSCKCMPRKWNLKNHLVRIQSCDRVEAVQRQKHIMVAAFMVVTGLMEFGMLFKIMQSWVLHLEMWRLVLQGMSAWRVAQWECWKWCGIVNPAGSSNIAWEEVSWSPTTQRKAGTQISRSGHCFGTPLPAFSLWSPSVCSWGLLWPCASPGFGWRVFYSCGGLQGTWLLKTTMHLEDRDD